jgi:hypothetical protein
MACIGDLTQSGSSELDLQTVEVVSFAKCLGTGKGQLVQCRIHLK